MLMTIADHTAYQYDRLKMFVSGGKLTKTFTETNVGGGRYRGHGEGTVLLCEFQRLGADVTCWDRLFQVHRREQNINYSML